MTPEALPQVELVMMMELTTMGLLHWSGEPFAKPELGSMQWHRASSPVKNEDRMVMSVDSGK